MDGSQWYSVTGIACCYLETISWYMIYFHIHTILGSHIYNQAHHTQLFKKLVEQQNDDGNLIQRDIHRTYPQYKEFADKNGKGYVINHTINHVDKLHCIIF